jgi:hypothetical protein
MPPLQATRPSAPPSSKLTLFDLRTACPPWAPTLPLKNRRTSARPPRQLVKTESYISSCEPVSGALGPTGCTQGPPVIPEHPATSASPGE